MMIFSLVAMIGLEKCCITSAFLQWLCHSGERTVARGPLVSFSQINLFIPDFSASMSAKVFKSCKLLLRVEVYCVKENKDTEIYYTFIFPFFHPSLHVKDFSGTTALGF